MAVGMDDRRGCAATIARTAVGICFGLGGQREVLHHCNQATPMLV
jgi:hypothetical protein